MRTFLARLLAPKMAEEQAAYHRLRSTLDDVRWWCGASHPEAASAVQFALDRDAWSRSLPAEDMPLAWRPPSYVWNVSLYRDWLDGKPFELCSSVGVSSGS